MKLAIFGASGATGKQLVDQALAAGHEVTAFVRDPSRLGVTHQRLRTVKGNVNDAGAVSQAVAGQDAVLSALGPVKPDFTSMTVGARHILAAMQGRGVQRLVTLTGAGVPDPNDRPKLFNHFITFLLKRISPGVLEDAQRHTDLVRASGVDWTVVRVGRLNDGPPTGNVQVGWVGTGPKPFISRADVAAFMLHEVTERRHLRQAPMISG